MRRAFVIALSLAAGLSACSEPDQTSTPGAGSEGIAHLCDTTAIQAVVSHFGERLKEVPLLAPDSVVVAALEAQYAPFVSPELLRAWIDDPDAAPGRDVSSPWPERIEISEVMPANEGRCRVEGEVVYRTSVEAAAGGSAARVPITLTVQHDDGWQIDTLEIADPAGAGPPDAPDDAATDPSAAADVIRSYYDAIANGDYERAYALWAGEGAASGQTFEQFAAGFAHTAHVEVEVAALRRVEPAAGSQYAELPVVVRAVTDADEQQRFEGTYTLRRSVVDGASPEERSWRIYAADVERVDDR